MPEDNQMSDRRARGLGSTKRRLSDDEIRDRMIKAAEGMVEETGLTVSLDHLSFEEVIGKAGVSRSAVYRIWPFKEEFYVDLVCELAGPSWQGSALGNKATIERALKLVLSNQDKLDTVEGRQWLVREAIRQVATSDFLALAGSKQWQTFVALSATVLSLPDGETRSRVLEALKSGEEIFQREITGFYETMARLLGFRMRDPYGGNFAVLTICGASVLEGLALRHLVSPELTDTKFLLPSGSEQIEWSIASIGFLAVFEQLIEVDPGYDLEGARAVLASMSTTTHA